MAFIYALVGMVVFFSFVGWLNEQPWFPLTATIIGWGLVIAVYCFLVALFGGN